MSSIVLGQEPEPGQPSRRNGGVRGVRSHRWGFLLKSCVHHVGGTPAEHPKGLFGCAWVLRVRQLDQGAGMLQGWMAQPSLRPHGQHQRYLLLLCFSKHLNIRSREAGRVPRAFPPRSLFLGTL